LRCFILTMMPVRLSLLAVASLMGLTLITSGCDQGPRQDPSSAGSHLAEPQIEWYEGDIDSAFALAESTGKPLFLYWGAEWCPPCHYLQNKIFSRPEFVAKTRDFVPVYLDGDTERAQILGERLEVQGYPTVIVFDPLGNEVMRMPHNIPLEHYEEVLDAAVAGLRPVSVVLNEVLASGPGEASPSDLRLLAFYSWDQDSSVDLPTGEKLEAFARLYRETPSDLRVEQSRFLTLYLLALVEEEQTLEDLASLRSGFAEILQDAELRNANLTPIFYHVRAIIDYLQPEETVARQELMAAWRAAAEAMEQDGALAVDDRLFATLLRVKLARLEMAAEAGETPELPSELQDHVRGRVAWAVEIVTDEGELMTVVNRIGYLLEESGLSSEAEALFLAKMDQTVAPYYFMSWIAGLKEEAGDTEAALAWYRKAYDSAQGRYSRFRWGSTYLRRLMDLAPEEVPTIEEDSLEILGELLTHEDSFAGGNFSRLDGLEVAYWEWNTEGKHVDTLDRIRDFVHSSCADYPDAGEDSQRQRCEAFLLDAGIEGDVAL